MSKIGRMSAVPARRLWPKDRLTGSPVTDPGRHGHAGHAAAIWRQLAHQSHGLPHAARNTGISANFAKFFRIGFMAKYSIKY